MKKTGLEYSEIVIYLVVDLSLLEFYRKCAEEPAANRAASKDASAPI